MTEDKPAEVSITLSLGILFQLAMERAHKMPEFKGKDLIAEQVWDDDYTVLKGIKIIATEASK